MKFHIKFQQKPNSCDNETIAQNLTEIFTEIIFFLLLLLAKPYNFAYLILPTAPSITTIKFTNNNNNNNNFNNNNNNNNINNNNNFNNNNKNTNNNNNNNNITTITVSQQQ